MTSSAYYVDQGGLLVPFAGTAEVIVDPPPGGDAVSRQLLGWSETPSGAGWQGAAMSMTNIELQRAAQFEWPGGGPPVNRLYRQQQNPPYSDMQRTLDGDRIPWVSIKPGSGGIAADITGGSNARFASWGQYCRDFYPKTIIFTYDHEVDRHAYSGSAVYSNVQYRNYQTDFVTAFRHCIDVMKAQDPTHSLDHVVFATNFTGWGFRPGSNRDPGLAWHPDFDMVTVDPYDFYVFNDGSKEPGGRRRMFSGYGGFSTGAIEHHTWCMDPLKWYDDIHPTWTPPATVIANLDKFPVRMGIGEVGFQPSMHPNSGNTQWIFEEDPDDPQNAMALQLTQMASDLRGTYQRYEVVVYWHSSTNAIGASAGSPNYFAGPAEHRWGCEWPGSMEAWRVETSKTNHQGLITPWSPEGLV